jgi:hypothetical protein
MTMNPETNKFEELPDFVARGSGLIQFNIGEEITIKGHIFRVVHIDIPKDPAQQHLLVLTPIRKP